MKYSLYEDENHVIFIPTSALFIQNVTLWLERTHKMSSDSQGTQQVRKTKVKQCCNSCVPCSQDRGSLRSQECRGSYTKKNSWQLSNLSCNGGAMLKPKSWNNKIVLRPRRRYTRKATSWAGTECASRPLQINHETKWSNKQTLVKKS